MHGALALVFADDLSRRRRLGVDQLMDNLCVASASLRAERWRQTKGSMDFGPGILWTLERGRNA